jgi:hypothetical protein
MQLIDLVVRGRPFERAVNRRLRPLKPAVSQRDTSTEITACQVWEDGTPATLSIGLRPVFVGLHRRGRTTRLPRTFATKEAAILAQRFECATKYARPIKKSTTSTTSPSAISVSQVIGSPPRQIASYRRSH